MRAEHARSRHRKNRLHISESGLQEQFLLLRGCHGNINVERMRLVDRAWSMLSAELVRGVMRRNHVVPMDKDPARAQRKVDASVQRTLDGRSPVMESHHRHGRVEALCSEIPLEKRPVDQRESAIQGPRLGT